MKEVRKVLYSEFCFVFSDEFRAVLVDQEKAQPLYDSIEPGEPVTIDVDGLDPVGNAPVRLKFSCKTLLRVTVQ